MLAQFISGSQRIFEGGISLTDAGRRFPRERMPSRLPAGRRRYGAEPGADQPKKKGQLLRWP